MINKGFTLIGILITLVIVGILAVAGISSITNMNRSAQLDASYRQIIAMINQAKGYAVNGFPVIDYTDSDHDDAVNDKVVANAYGVYFKTTEDDTEEDKVFIFADYDKNSTKGYYSIATSEDPNIPDAASPITGADLVLFKYELPVNFKVISDNANTLMYYPPLGNFKSMKITSENIAYPITISICYKDCAEGNLKKEIKIYKGAGLPEK